MRQSKVHYSVLPIMGHLLENAVEIMTPNTKVDNTCQ